MTVHVQSRPVGEQKVTPHIRDEITPHIRDEITPPIRDEITPHIRDDIAPPIRDELDGVHAPNGLAGTPAARVKPPVSPDVLAHARFSEDEFWRRIPGYRDVDRQTFLDHSWQSRHSATSPARLQQAVGELAPAGFFADVEDGFHRAPMAMRLSPYIISLIDWENAYSCPLRTQFVPVGARLLRDHPKLHLDTLHEQADSPTPGLTHRYFDKALFLPLNTCPVYCRFCTRSCSPRK
jgi:lysine 2,3-aminomutase